MMGLTGASVYTFQHFCSLKRDADELLEDISLFSPVGATLTLSYPVMHRPANSAFKSNTSLFDHVLFSPSLESEHDSHKKKLNRDGSAQLRLILSQCFGIQKVPPARPLLDKHIFPGRVRLT